MLKIFRFFLRRSVLFTLVYDFKVDLCSPDIKYMFWAHNVSLKLIKTNVLVYLPKTFKSPMKTWSTPVQISIPSDEDSWYIPECGGGGFLLHHIHDLGEETLAAPTHQQPTNEIHRHINNPPMKNTDTSTTYQWNTPTHKQPANEKHWHINNLPMKYTDTSTTCQWKILIYVCPVRIYSLFMLKYPLVFFVKISISL